MLLFRTFIWFTLSDCASVTRIWSLTLSTCYCFTHCFTCSTCYCFTHCSTCSTCYCITHCFTCSLGVLLFLVQTVALWLCFCFTHIHQFTFSLCYRQFTLSMCFKFTHASIIVYTFHVLPFRLYFHPTPPFWTPFPLIKVLKGSQYQCALALCAFFFFNRSNTERTHSWKFLPSMIVYTCTFCAT